MYWIIFIMAILFLLPSFMMDLYIDQREHTDQVDTWIKISGLVKIAYITILLIDLIWKSFTESFLLSIPFILILIVGAVICIFVEIFLLQLNRLNRLERKADTDEIKSVYFGKEFSPNSPFLAIQSKLNLELVQFQHEVALLYQDQLKSEAENLAIEVQKTLALVNEESFTYFTIEHCIKPLEDMAKSLQRLQNLEPLSDDKVKTLSEAMQMVSIGMKDKVNAIREQQEQESALEAKLIEVAVKTKNLI